MVMMGPLIDVVEQMLSTQKMSDSCRTAVAQCIYTCRSTVFVPVLQNDVSITSAKCLQAIANVWMYLNMPGQHFG